MILVAGRYTLLDQSALDSGLLELCGERGLGVIAGGVFNSGVLAAPTAESTYDYLPVASDRLHRATRIAAICERHGTSLAAAALHFVAEQPTIATVLIGARDADELRADVAMLDGPVDPALWAALRDEGLLLLP